MGTKGERRIGAAEVLLSVDFKLQEGTLYHTFSFKHLGRQRSNINDLFLTKEKMRLTQTDIKRLRHRRFWGTFVFMEWAMEIEKVLLSLFSTASCW